MIAFITVSGLGILISVLGVINMTGNISSIHSYHRHRVTQENIKPFGKDVYKRQVMGSGMSLVMTDIGATVGIADPMIPGIVIGVVGMAVAIINYPIYKGILASRRKKYADKIIALSEKIMKG